MRRAKRGGQNKPDGKVLDQAAERPVKNSNASFNCRFTILWTNQNIMVAFTRNPLISVAEKIQFQKTVKE